MFAGFFYALKKESIPVSFNEWLLLMHALDRDLACNSLSAFYYLARAVLIKSEKHFDRYDSVFAAYFAGIESGEEISLTSKDFAAVSARENNAVLPPSLTEPEESKDTEEHMDLTLLKGNQQINITENKADYKYSGGKGAKIEASAGDSGGVGEGGIRFGGSGGGLTALKVAGQRKYKDYRDDKLSNIRQFEMALSSLRQLSSRLEGPKDELDLEATIEATGGNGGMLDLIWARPRRNNLKIIILMDSVGSIDRYHDVCKRLFNAAHRATHFKEIKFYYFHNCVYDVIYKGPMVNRGNAIPTDEFFRTRNSEHRLIIVGDATMHINELLKVGGAINFDENNSETGLTWLNRLAAHYPYAVWLNPVPEGWWRRDNYKTIPLIAEIFPMFELNPKGLERAIKKIRHKNY
jgi:uncharacterized protein with von Willebrand factor type A (vWA) domain